jgi:hypothetical protein
MFQIGVEEFYQVDAIRNITIAIGMAGPPLRTERHASPFMFSVSARQGSILLMQFLSKPRAFMRPLMRKEIRSSKKRI